MINQLVIEETKSIHLFLEDAVAVLDQKVKKAKDINKILDEKRNELIASGVDKQELSKLEASVRSRAKEAAIRLSKGDVKAVRTITQQIFDEMRKTKFVSQLSISMFLLINVLIVSSFLLFLIANFIILTGLPTVLIIPLHAIFVAPIVEEYGKFLSVKIKATGAYFIVFNIVEFSKHVASGLFIGFPIIPLIILRLVVVVLHWFLTKIHFVAKKEHTEKSKYWLTVLIHAIWNFFASLVPAF